MIEIWTQWLRTIWIRQWWTLHIIQFFCFNLIQKCEQNTYSTKNQNFEKSNQKLLLLCVNCVIRLRKLSSNQFSGVETFLLGVFWSGYCIVFYSWNELHVLVFHQMCSKSEHKWVMMDGNLGGIGSVIFFILQITPGVYLIRVEILSCDVLYVKTKAREPICDIYEISSDCIMTFSDL